MRDVVAVVLIAGAVLIALAQMRKRDAIVSIPTDDPTAVSRSPEGPGVVPTILDVMNAS